MKWRSGLTFVASRLPHLWWAQASLVCAVTQTLGVCPKRASVLRKALKQIMIANGCLLHYSYKNVTYHINRVRRDD